MPTSTTTYRTHNFNAGPAALPLEVLQKAQAEFTNFRGSGMSVMELSHRSKLFESVIEDAEAGIRELLNVPDNYAVLFLQGGASLQFSMVPMNLAIPGKPVDVYNTGVWSKKAIAELKKGTEYRVVASGEDRKFTSIPDWKTVPVNPDASYVHVTSNNTIYGTQWVDFPSTGDIPLVADMSSDILSRPLDITQFGLIYAGAQKNIGPSGVTLVIMRKDLAERCPESVPTMLQYRTHIAEKSLYNTPPTFGIYFISLVTQWIRENGGIKWIEAETSRRAESLYNAIEASELFYCPNEKAFRSKMNVVFRSKAHDDDLENRFVKQAESQGLICRSKIGSTRL
ncbi:3-phosphoserine/phosphohydroxythreonine transaminase [bacterium]|nr:3-phosphoserine/phosphohydroxythreonine transaminase [bacterium]